MDVRPELQIQTMIKAMVDVVLPAVDPNHRMAQEQARLVIATLRLVAQRLPIAYRYDRDELERYAALARDVLVQIGAAVPAPTTATLERLVARASDVLDRARAEPAELEAATFEMRAAVGELIQSVDVSGDAPARTRLRKLILEAARTELQRERALVVDMGFETGTAAVPPPIEKQLAGPCIGNARRRADGGDS
jgi:hypothetical protein